jgi:hypothetical protein
VLRGRPERPVRGATESIHSAPQLGLAFVKATARIR